MSSPAGLLSGAGPRRRASAKPQAAAVPAADTQASADTVAPRGSQAADAAEAPAKKRRTAKPLRAPGVASREQGPAWTSQSLAAAMAHLRQADSGKPFRDLQQACAAEHAALTWGMWLQHWRACWTASTCQSDSCQSLKQACLRRSCAAFCTSSWREPLQMPS